MEEIVLLSADIDDRRRLVLVHRRTGRPERPEEWVHWIENRETGDRELGSYHATFDEALITFADRCRRHGARLID